MTHRTLTIGAALALLACSPTAVPSVDTAARNTAAVAELTATLDDALTATTAFGRTTLGHSPELDAKGLAQHGFTPAAEVTVAVHADHTGFCLAAEHAELPSDHPWRIASVDSRTQRVTPGNACSNSTTVAGGGALGLVCTLPAADA